MTADGFGECRVLESANHERILLSGWSKLGAYTAGLGISVVLACESPTTPLPAGAVSFAAPPEYELWWRMTETCAGRQGKLEQVSWYVVPGVPTVTTPAGDVAQRLLGTAG